MATFEEEMKQAAGREIEPLPGADYFTSSAQPIPSLEYKKELPFEEWARQQNEEEEKALKKRKLDLFNEWAKGEVVEAEFNAPEALEEAAWGESWTDLSYNPLHVPQTRIRQLEKRWRDFWHKKEKDRLAKVPEDYKKIEVRNAGLGAQAFADSFLDHFTFGFHKGEHPIYGQLHRQYNPIANGTGAVLGEVGNFMALAAATGFLGTPAKLANVMRRSKGAYRLLNAMGYYPYHAAKISKLGEAFRVASRARRGMIKGRKLMEISQVGANQIHMGLLTLARDKVNEKVRKYMAEDQMTEKEWRTGLLPGMESFFAGYSLSVINSPISWAARFAGDFLWSAAAQGYRILTGQQERWDHQQFATDWLLGHALGEVQGKIWSRMTPDLRKEMFSKNPGIKDNYSLLVKHPESVKHGLGDDILLEAAVTVDMKEAMHRADNGGRGFTAEQRRDAVDTALIPHIRNHEVKTVFENDFVGKIDVSEPQLAMRFAEERLVRRLGSRMGWTEAMIERAINAGIMQDRKAFQDFLVAEKIPLKVKVSAPSIKKKQAADRKQDLEDLRDMRSELEFYEKELAGLDKKRGKVIVDEAKVKQYEGSVKGFQDFITRHEKLIEENNLQIEKLEKMPQDEKTLASEGEKNYLIQRQEHHKRQIGKYRREIKDLNAVIKKEKKGRVDDSVIDRQKNEYLQEIANVVKTAKERFGMDEADFRNAKKKPPVKFKKATREGAGINIKEFIDEMSRAAKTFTGTYKGAQAKDHARILKLMDQLEKFFIHKDEYIKGVSEKEVAEVYRSQATKDELLKARGLEREIRTNLGKYQDYIEKNLKRQIARAGKLAKYTPYDDMQGYLGLELAFLNMASYVKYVQKGKGINHILDTAILNVVGHIQTANQRYVLEKKLDKGESFNKKELEAWDQMRPLERAADLEKLHYAKLREKEPVITEAIRDDLFDYEPGSVTTLPALERRKDAVLRKKTERHRRDWGQAERLSQTELAQMLVVAKENPTYWMNVALRFLSKYRHFTNLDFHRGLLWRLGVQDLSAKQIENKINHIGRRITDAANKAAEAYPKMKKEMDPTDVMILYNTLRAERGKLNELTGMFKEYDLPSVARATYDNGAYVLSLKEAYDEMGRQYGKEIADIFLQKAANLVAKHVVDFNKTAGQGEIHIRNPEEEDNTKMIFISSGVSKKDFDEAILDLHNRLGGRYEGDRANEHRRFVINIHKPDGSIQSISKFKNVSTAYTLNPQDLGGLAKAHNTINYLVDILNPDLAARFKDVLFDMSDSGIKARTKRILDVIGGSHRDFNSLVDFLNANPGRRVRAQRALYEMVLDLKMIDPQLPAVVESELWNNIEMVEKSEGNRGAEETRASIRNQGIDQYMSVEEGVNTYFHGETRNMANLDGDLSGIHNYARVNAEESKQQFVDRFYNNAKANDAENRPPLEGIRKFGKGVHQFFKEKFTLWEDRKNVQHLQKSITRAAAARERLTDVDSTRLIEEVYSDFVQTKIPGATMKERHLNFEVFQRLQPFIRETEFKGYFEDIEARQLKEDLIKRLATEEINWSGDPRIDVETLISNPKHLTGAEIFNIWKRSADDLVISKILVQKLGIKAKDLVDFMIRKDDVFYKTIDQLFTILGEEFGFYKNLDLFENLKKAQRKVLRGLVTKYFDHTGKKAAELDFGDFKSEKNGIPFLVNLFKQIKDPKIKIDAELTLKHYIDFTPEKLMYEHHRILAFPDGRKVFGSEINSKLRDAEAGRVKGPKQLSPIADELLGREIPTLYNLIEKGYKVELNSFQVEKSLITYLFSRLYNQHMADGFRKQFHNHLVEKLAPTTKIPIEYEGRVREWTWKELKDADFSDAKKYKLMHKFADEKEARLEAVVETLADMGGYFWKPVDAEISRAKRNKKHIANRIKELQAIEERPEAEIRRLKDKLQAESKKIRDMNYVNRVLSGYEFTKERQELINFFRESDDPNIPKMNADLQNQLKSDVVDRKRYWTEKIMEAITGGEQHMPFNWKTHESDHRAEHKVFNTEAYKRARVGADRQPLIAEEIRRAQALAPNLPGWDGLYFDRVAVKNFKQYLFRDDLSQKLTGYEFLNKTLGLIGRVNSTLKVITLYKPTIMMANDIVQMTIGTPWGLAAKGAKNWKFAVKAYQERFTTRAGNEYAEFYWLMNKYDLFNHSVGVESIIHDATRAWYKVMGEDQFLGLKHYISSVFRKRHPDMDAETALGKAGNFVKENLGRISRGYKGYQELAWSIDEVMRITMAKTMFDKLIKVYPNDREHAAFLAADYTNLHMVQYSRVPSFTRMILNFFFIYPTYRVGTGRMYKEMFKNFGRGVKRIAGGTPDQMYMVSDNKWEQALFEMGPLLRALALRGAIKGLLVSMLGYGYEDPWDAFTNYRAHKLAETQFGEQYRYLALSTPLFELEKYITRPFALTLRNNISASMRWIWAVKTNTNPVTGKPLWTSPNRAEATKQLAWEFFRMNFPFGSDISNWADEDVSLAVKIFNTGGLGYVYDIENPNKMIKDFYAALDKTKTIGELRAAQRTFHTNMRRAYHRTFGKKFKTLEETIEEQRRVNDQQPR